MLLNLHLVNPKIIKSNTMKLFNVLLFSSLLLSGTELAAEENTRWQIAPDSSIVWQGTQGIPHQDHLEMSGKTVSVVLRYGIDSQGQFQINKSMVWPLLRTIPNNTHASLMRRYDWNTLDCITVNGQSLLSGEKVQEIKIKGNLSVKSQAQGRGGQWEIIREYFPSTENPAFMESYKIINHGKGNLTIEIPQNEFTAKTDPKQGVQGAYTITGKTYNTGCHTLSPGDTLSFGASLSAYAGTVPAQLLPVAEEKSKRDSLVRLWMSRQLILDTPDPVINQMFAFSKIRACESIYETQGGPMHGPGGESYYAAIWANDQAEYVNPYFPFVGYDYGNESARNAFHHFARFMNEAWKPIPSSIIAEGLDIWNGAGDRGDAAMIAYGAARYALALGDRKTAEELWPLITWCLEYCQRNLNEKGVVASDTDELENRFPSGDANLCTSSLYYDALLSASYLAEELQKGKKTAATYQKQAKELRQHIEEYFGATVEGFNTYAYYLGNDVLRSWICIPLTVGIYERAQATIDALFSPRLWTENGLLTQAGSKTFWDRSTLYALRGVYAAGETEKATDYLHRYSAVRLLGEHVPYAIEAWPEGEQRHLSAESGLYGRIITEGIFGIRPCGFKSFNLTPRLPRNWQKMSLRRIGAFQSTFDLEISRLPKNKLKVRVIQEGKVKEYTIKESATVRIRLT